MKVCSKCILPEDYPGIIFDENGVCNHCTDSGANAKEAGSESFTEDELKLYLNKYRNLECTYDVLVPVSGGVDSSIALINLVEKYNLKPLAFHNDHGYEHEIATSNVKKLCKKLNVDLVIWQHDYEFMNKLFKYTNELSIEGLSACYLCGSILYLNGLELAEKFNIPLVINGYSKGQVDLVNNMEKGQRLGEEVAIAIGGTGDIDFINTFAKKFELLEKQKVLGYLEDLKFEPDPDKIAFMSYYMFGFNKFDKEATREICKENFDWQPMQFTYPSRTTNCEMVWLNTYFDLKKMNFSVYTEEYSGLIRKGELTREQALKDLKFDPPEGLLERLSQSINIDLNMSFK